MGENQIIKDENIQNYLNKIEIKHKFDFNNDSLINSQYKIKNINDRKFTDDNNNIEELYSENNLTEDGLCLNSRVQITKIPDININTLRKFEDYIHENIEKIKIPSQNFSCKIKYLIKYIFLDITFISNAIVFYHIGKYCAKSNMKLDFGLICLTDFKHILNFQDNYKLSQKNQIKIIKSKFWKGVIYIFQKRYKIAKEKLEKIQKFLERNEKLKKINFIKRYFEWINKFFNELCNEEFIITKLDLHNL